MRKRIIVYISLLLVILAYAGYSFIDFGNIFKKSEATYQIDGGLPDTAASNPATPESSYFSPEADNSSFESTSTPGIAASSIPNTPDSVPAIAASEIDNKPDGIPESNKTKEPGIKSPDKIREDGSANNRASVKENIYEIKGLVELQKLDDSFVIDLRYATENNFTGKIIYSKAVCLINKNTAKKLIAANNEFKEMGYRIKVFDAYRPFSAQKILWEAADDKSFVANPNKGSIHNRGAAVDVTLVDKDGKEVDMPSGYDEFTDRARINYTGCTELQKENRELLARVMVKHGFKRISNEWWHFDDTNAQNYPILDVSFEEFYND